MKGKIITLETEVKVFVSDGSTGSITRVNLLHFQLLERGFSPEISLKICETLPDCETFADLLEAVE